MKEHTEVADPRAQKLREIAELIEEALFASMNRATNGNAGEQKIARKAWRATAQAVTQFLDSNYEPLKGKRKPRADDGLDIIRAVS